MKNPFRKKPVPLPIEYNSKTNPTWIQIAVSFMTMDDPMGEGQETYYKIMCNLN